VRLGYLLPLILPPEIPLSHIDLRALDSAFTGWRLDRVPTLTPEKAFERFCFEQILKDYELSDEEISAGDTGKSDDGGVDGLYFFAGRKLITLDGDVPDEAAGATLIVIQATTSTGGFSETRIERFESFVRDMLDYTVPPSQFTHLTSKARDLISNFRGKYQSLITRQHTLDVVFYYAAKTHVTPDRNTKVHTRYRRLERYVKSQLTNANVTLELWNSSKLLKRFREQPEQRIPLEVTRNFATDNGDVVCLARLSEFFKFLRGKDGNLRTGILEPNVRDYQGRRNPVNTDIRKTLDNPPLQEFWWLNNGITVLVDECSITGSVLAMTNPEIVNGLQTSYEVFEFFKEQSSRVSRDHRSIVLRVIRPPNERAGSLITKATNFQTEVKGISLHATEEIHFNIEDKLLLSGLFYDRKKGKYKRLKKPVANIVSVMEMARAVIAILLRRPDDARARPQSLLNRDDTYLLIFDKHYDCDLYLACITLDRKVVAFLAGFDKAAPEEKRDIRYYVDMWLGCELTKSHDPTGQMIIDASANFKTVTDVQIENACKAVLKKYRQLGGNENIAKGSELAPALQRALNRRNFKVVK
jgi:hypothetical protein